VGQTEVASLLLDKGASVQSKDDVRERETIVMYLNEFLFAVLIDGL
jgi:hypothetical protein